MDDLSIIIFLSGMFVLVITAMIIWANRDTTILNNKTKEFIVVHQTDAQIRQTETEWKTKYEIAGLEHKFKNSALNAEIDMFASRQLSNERMQSAALEFGRETLAQRDREVNSLAETSKYLADINQKTTAMVQDAETQRSRIASSTNLRINRENASVRRQGIQTYAAIESRRISSNENISLEQIDLGRYHEEQETMRRQMQCDAEVKKSIFSPWNMIGYGIGSVLGSLIPIPRLPGLPSPPIVNNRNSSILPAPARRSLPQLRN